MNNELEITAKEIVEYMLENKSSIRATANHFGCSKTLIWSRIQDYNGKDKDKLQEQLINNKKYNSRFKEKGI